MQYDNMLQDKNVLITGGASQIGRACAVLFANHGANVAVADINAHAGNALVDELNRTGGINIFIHADLREAHSIDAMCDKFVSVFGAPDVWLNCAGVCREAFADEISEGDLEEMFSLNLLAAFRIMKRLAPCMMKKRNGSVIQVSSGYALTGVNGMSSYAATKGGLYAMTNAFAMDYLPYGIRANSILPGGNIASLGDKVAAEMSEAEAMDYWERTQMLPRRGEPDEVAKAALFLASDMSRLVTGEGVFVNGGQNTIPHKQTYRPMRREAMV